MYQKCENWNAFPSYGEWLWKNLVVVKPDECSIFKLGFVSFNSFKWWSSKEILLKGKFSIYDTKKIHSLLI